MLAKLIMVIILLYVYIKSLCCTPESNILYVNCNTFLKFLLNSWVNLVL